MTGFKPRTSGVGRDRSTNWANTTAHLDHTYCVNDFALQFLWQNLCIKVVIVYQTDAISFCSNEGTFDVI